MRHFDVLFNDFAAYIRSLDRDDSRCFLQLLIGFKNPIRLHLKEGLIPFWAAKIGKHRTRRFETIRSFLIHDSAPSYAIKNRRVRHAVSITSSASIPRVAANLSSDVSPLVHDQAEPSSTHFSHFLYIFVIIIFS
jgi:hypothetical protein